MAGMLQGVKRRARRVPGYALLRSVVRLAVGPARHEAWLQLVRPAGLFQPYATTAMDRYPDCFAFVRDAVGDGPERRILSFGCATGEEVASLRRVFARARITGIDINPANIRLARRRLRQGGDAAGIDFRCAGSVVDEPSGRYDAVFAMAVFRHGDLTDHPARCDHRIRFADFDRAAADLARALRPGGLLVIRHAHFRFADTTVAAGFERAAAFRPPPDPQPLYGRDDRLLPDRTCADGIFRKA